MTELNERIQMKIFDLLEGNLNRNDAEILLKEIENDKQLLREYELLKRTYLPAEESIVFPNKSALYKKAAIETPTAATLVVSYKKYWSGAAAILLLVGSAYYFMKDTTEKIPTTTKNELVKGTGDVKSKNPEFQAKISKPIVVDIERKTIKKENGLINKNSHKRFQISSSENKLVEFNSGVLKSKGMNESINKKIETKNETVAKNTENKVLILPVLTSQKLKPVDETVYYLYFDDSSNLPKESYKRRKSIQSKLLRTGKTLMAKLEIPEVSLKKGSNGKYKVDVQPVDVKETNIAFNAE